MSKTTKSFIWRIISIFFACCILLIAFATKPPSLFSSPTIFHVAKDSSLEEISSLLVKKRMIKSPILFKAGIILFSGRKGVLAGDYVFHRPENILTIAYRLAKGDQGLERLKVTIPEGNNVYDTAYLILKQIPNFNAPYFIKIAKGEEGYLFPDTYYFLQNVTATEVLKAMKNNFNEKISIISDQIKNSGHSLSDIVIMASIVEEEARTTESRKIIAGILWKRIKENIPLQVDVSLLYITNNSKGLVSIDDTKIDSPYNTYKYKGLPVGPITNPGLGAIKTVLEPQSTPYYFYLSDKKGEMHYAETFEGHKVNRQKYNI